MADLLLPTAEVGGACIYSRLMGMLITNPA